MEPGPITTAGVAARRVKVAASLQKSAPNTLLSRPSSRPTSRSTATMGSSGSTSAGGTSDPHCTDGWFSANQESAFAAAMIQSVTSRSTALPKPCSSARAGR